MALREAAALRDEVKDRLDAPASYLSGGQQHRSALAQSAGLDLRILLLMDDAAAHSTPVAGGAIEDLIARLARRCTVVLVTRCNLAGAGAFSPLSALLWPSARGGRVIEHRRRDEFFGAPTHESPENRHCAGRGNHRNLASVHHRLLPWPCSWSNNQASEAVRHAVSGSTSFPG